jgi:ferrochelatase
MRTKVILAQLGSPANIEVSSVRRYLAKFLSDRRVIDLPWWWSIILYLFILPFRPKKSAALYAHLWDGEQFPLVRTTFCLAQKINDRLQRKGHRDLEVQAGFLLSVPSVKSLVEDWEKQLVSTRAEHLVIFSQFPQYSESTIASVWDALAEATRKSVNLPHVTFISHFHRLRSWIDLSVEQILKTSTALQHRRPESDTSQVPLIISFHGIPKRRVDVKKDVYRQHCQETFDLLQEGLRRRGEQRPIYLCFQSRFGREEWLGPYSSVVARELAQQGHKDLLVVCPSFTVDCLETKVEMGIELPEELHSFGTQIHLVSCVNDHPEWVTALSELVVELAENGPLAIEKASYPV